MEIVKLEDLKSWAQKSRTFLDVRSPEEFEQGHLPGAYNVPILDNDERALVGATYKQMGRDLAVKLGHKIVSGTNRDQKLQTWIEVATKNEEIILTCFRGGLRSQITQAWLKEVGIDRPLISGGYKACRQLLIEKIRHHCQHNRFLVVSGPTGAAKTHFLRKASAFWPALDLEAYAHHRGSAFGKMDEPQPHQAVFENRLAWDLLKKEDQANFDDVPMLVEDESRLIGRCVQPDDFFANLRQSEVLWLDVPLDQRVENTFQDYIAEPLKNGIETDLGLRLFKRYKVALHDIRNRLGGVRYDELQKILAASEEAWTQHRDLEQNRVWIRKLLAEYYDPMYFGSLDKRSPKIYFRGSAEEALDLLKGAKSKKSEAPVRRKAQST